MQASLTPKYVLPPKKPTVNDATGFSTKWAARFFPHWVTYPCPSSDATSPTFEGNFARPEHADQS